MRCHFKVAARWSIGDCKGRDNCSWLRVELSESWKSFGSKGESVSFVQKLLEKGKGDCSSECRRQEAT